MLMDIGIALVLFVLAVIAFRIGHFVWRLVSLLLFVAMLYKWYLIFSNFH